MRIAATGSRGDMLRLERFLTERIPGYWNREPWAGAQRPFSLIDHTALQSFYGYVAQTYELLSR
jgi:hypothetical protein